MLPLPTVDDEAFTDIGVMMGVVLAGLMAEIHFARLASADEATRREGRA